ncbi:ketoacyl-synt-domain-containing protein [Parathielavia hyrcaniae]|uniref:Ketoacyl-synt-domain-containing protein n=1 Tax=Parathielavia hyrcaniae TaxID=113614 RepID=A0AAN6Q5F2_9PEZI|nr:ketoacyl-synt-domain-containing protein [Parathielavia hyrcaniae]
MPYKNPISEPIVVVGASCRFAGGVTTPSRLWELLEDPVDLTRDVPPERFNIKAFYHPDGEHHGTTNSPEAYFLDQNHRVFDASFFNISPKEAEAIDPQQRMVLEVVYEALESSGYTLHQYAGEKVAVFAGLMTADYDTLSQRDELDTSQYYATGNARSILSNRISYFFDFNGPSMTIDTACSSSLVALHQAVLSLRSGECGMACVTGANLILTPEQFVVESNLHMLSPTGHCRMWDAAADGYARGEGIAAIFIKPLSQALADGDHIEAIIRETGVNSDGRSRGITMPNWEAQSRLIQDTYQRAGLDPNDPDDRCQYFEAHGTGTTAGDPNEARAIEDAFFGRDKDFAAASSDNKMVVGSVKTIVGHTEGAAGLAGLLKVIESMRHSTVPPNLHLDQLNPRVQKYCSHLIVPTSPVAWPRVSTGQPKRGSVNSFGFGGTNAHAIVEQYVPEVHDPLAEVFRPGLKRPMPMPMRQIYNPNTQSKSRICLPLVLSAPSQKSLTAIVKRYRGYLSHGPVVRSEEVAWHAYARRTAFPFRTSVSSLSVSGLVDKLDSLIVKCESSSTAAIGIRARPKYETPKILGVFTGQGAQWATMSRGLLLSSPVYANIIRSLDEILRTCPDPPPWSLEHEIMADEGLSRVKMASVSQPLCTAVQLALIELLRHLGIAFHTVIGHSSGEIAAAYAASRISLRDAILISHYRGMGVHMACGANGAKGGMLAAGLAKAEATEFCAQKKYSGRLWISASNAPSSATLSGDLDAVKQACEDLTKQQKFARLLFVDTAYHSPHMKDSSVKYLQALEACGIVPTNGDGTNWVSSVYGAGEPSDTELAAEYWKNNMVNPVLFYDAVGTALETHGRFDCVIEVGPHAALKGPVTHIIKEKNIPVFPYYGLLDRKLDDREAFANFLGWMWAEFGSSSSQIRRFVTCSLQPDLVHARLCDAPTYPWDHSQPFYRESRISRQYHFKPDKPHELLGVRTRDDNKHQLRWRNILKFQKLPWVKHHNFQGQALFPASAYLIMALDAARAALAGRHASVVELRDLRFPSGVILESHTPGVETLFNLTIEQETKSTIDASFTLTSIMADGGTNMKKNFSGRLSVLLEDPSAGVLPTRPKERVEALHARPDAFYQMMAGIGLAYTSPFKALQTIERRYNFASGTLHKYHTEDTTTLPISPATLDGCFQTAFLTVSSPGDNAIWTSFLPLEIDSVRFNLAICDVKDRDQDQLVVDAYMTKETPITAQTAASFTTDIEIFNPVGQMEIQVQGLTVGSFSSTKLDDDHELYLTTKFDVDPDDEIVDAETDGIINATNPMLIESCERVASFYAYDRWIDRPRPASSSLTEVPALRNSWPSETEKTLDAFIRESPYFLALDFIRELGKNLPDLLTGMLPAVIDEAHQLSGFQQHVSRVVRQIAHKYPRMSVLALTDPELGLTEHVLEGLQDAFVLYRIGYERETNFESRIQASDSLRTKTMVDRVDLSTPGKEQGQLFDLVLLTTSVIESQKTATALQTIRRMMRPGGFLMLVDVSRAPLRHRIQRCAGVVPNGKDLPSPPDWPDVLDQCGFECPMKNGHQYCPSGFSLIVRQADSPKKRMLQQPLAIPNPIRLVNRLLIVGGKQMWISLIASGVSSDLASHCGDIEVVPTLESLKPADLGSFNAVIFLNDIDEPVLATMTKERMGVLRALFKPEMTILWVTHNARFYNPDHAASFGFARTLAAETPGLVLQMLDLETLYTALAVNTISESFARLAKQALIGPDMENKPLWINEREVHLENGRRLIPRVLPWKDGNDRVNASRRVVSNSVNTLENVVEIVHTHAPLRQVKALFPSKGAWVIDMLPEASKLSKMLMQSLPGNCRYSTYSSLSNVKDVASFDATFKRAVHLALFGAASWKSDIQPRLITVPDLVRSVCPRQAFQIVDWKAERSVSQIVKPLVGTQLLDPAKTYQGARHIVLCSRKPPKTQPRWQAEMLSSGVTVLFEALDVTILEQVVAFKAKLAEILPPVGGVVNGAMVLEDRVFSQMSLDTLQRVMQPKTVGSRNLDIVFDNPDMDFFIMTSSFAAIGGHAGQSNYAAANMYMNGLAASRRQRRLPGSVLNIGVIYGLGFLYREKDDLYEGLEREGYPPISERDIHHMFVEAIAAGKPSPDQVYDITTGLRRFPAHDPRLSWQHDPRFSHFTTRADESDDSGKDGVNGEQKRTLKQLMDAADNVEDMVEVLVGGFVDRLQSQLQLPDGSVTGEHSIAELGVDSLAAVELRAWAWKSLGQDLAVMKILSGGAIVKLCAEIAGAAMDARNSIKAGGLVGDLEEGDKKAAPTVSVGGSETTKGIADGSEIIVLSPVLDTKEVNQGYLENRLF